MKILEIQKPSENSGIFDTCFKVNYPAEYTKIFGDINPKQLDTYTGIKYGLRDMIPALTADTWVSGVNAVIAVYVQPWCKQADLLTLTYDVLNPVTSEEQTDTTTSINATDNSTGELADKKFNDTEYNGSERTTDTTTQEKQQTQSVSHTTSGIGHNRSFAATIREEINLRKTQWQRGIIEQLINEITLSIYN